VENFRPHTSEFCCVDTVVKQGRKFETDSVGSLTLTSVKGTVESTVYIGWEIRTNSDACGTCIQLNHARTYKLHAAGVYMNRIHK